MLAHLEEEEAAMDRKVPANDNASETSDPPLPPPATDEEVAEAREIVRKAEQDVAQRNQMKAKVKTASRDDLQAMINARLNNR